MHNKHKTDHGRHPPTCLHKNHPSSHLLNFSILRVQAPSPEAESNILRMAKVKDKEPDAIIEWLNTILTDTQTFLAGRDILNFTSVFKALIIELQFTQVKFTLLVVNFLKIKIATMLFIINCFFLCQQQKYRRVSVPLYSG